MEFVDLTQTPVELQQLLVKLGLAKTGEIPVITPLTGGVSSGIYRIELASGAYCLKQALPQLKVAKEWLVPVDRVFAEIDWLNTAATVVPANVPRVLGQDAASKSFVMEYLAGDYTNWKAAMLAGQVDAGVARQVGDVLGRIHQATADDDALRTRFATDANFYAIRLEPYLVETARVHPELAARLLHLVTLTQNNRKVLVHGDVSPKNIMVGAAGPVLLDAECAWYGEPAFDVAFCLNHLLLKAAWMPQHLAALMQAFQALADAYFAHVDFESPRALEQRVAHLLPALTLARIDGKSPAEYLDEGARGRVRAAAIPLLQSPVDRLDEIRDYWTKEFSK